MSGHDVESQSLRNPKKSLAFKAKKFYASYKLQMLVAETMGTGTLTFWGCMGCIDWWGMPGLPIQAALNFGLTVAFIMAMINHISYAVINPAIVVVALGFKKLSITMSFLYIIFQLIGGTTGYALLQLVMPPNYVLHGFCSAKPHPALETWQFFIVEFLIVSALAFVCIGEWDSRTQHLQDSMPLKVGLAISALCLAGSPVGISMNPAFAFASAFYHWDWEHHWIYWIAGFLGSTSTMVFWHYFFKRDQKLGEITKNEEDKPNI